MRTALMILVAVGLLGVGCADKRPVLKPIDVRYGIYLSRLQVHTTITPDGLLTSVRTGGA